MSVTIKQPSPAATDAESADPVQALSEEERRQRQIELNQPTIELLRSWLELEDEQEDSPEEQREALEELMRGIDENRPPGAKLFSRYLS